MLHIEPQALGINPNEDFNSLNKGYRLSAGLGHFVGFRD